MILLSVSSCGLNWMGGGFPAGGWLVGGVWASTNKIKDLYTVHVYGGLQLLLFDQTTT